MRHGMLRLALTVVLGGLFGCLGTLGVSLGWAAAVGAAGYPLVMSQWSVIVAANMLMAFLGCFGGCYLAVRIARPSRGLGACLLGAVLAWLMLMSGYLQLPPPRAISRQLLYLEGTALAGSALGGALAGWLSGRRASLSNGKGRCPLHDV